ncbi:BTE_HP_G0181160.mRNA.1.CDS.1 [Saccharomyces cerevisiae]|nr:BTE_HP_G0009780.mRNA.1.CDS.1 [Saccharomyces cerevisiae]CAI5155367.1 BTE_HP_G0126390.mRNA.1.CDS.1 [Saccharomyces cerevisiae]CAI5215591.1 BTE_HP_G0181160.mRNA.1.CDS.1 [Saccharomyces cerevisiae]CAI6504766.1 BTE_HP_G0009780.mRNA.1.CDS.1 [Saccharomyces cerevisiae]CAI6991535.1 BTE_HP_G0126390.mRNA.1.CDS.1 [Saccharomyces cerevisiae]
MPVSVITTVLACLWLSYRLYKFLTIPVSSIVSTLKIKTPPATKVSIDKIATDSVTIHWENEPVKAEDNGSADRNFISHYLLYLNNTQLAIFPNNPNSLYTCCSITGLEAETQYQLDFITINNKGFINKLPSIYCMTKAREANEALKTRKWRRNTITSSTAMQPSNSKSELAPLPSHYSSVSLSTFSSNITNSATSNNGSNLPAYTSLTTLKDLDSFSIDDLKKILICAQEDLHDVLSQQTSLLQDFQESKLELELELDNLKTHWSHEIDLRKSLKSNIKSLENSKLLTDLKIEKLNKKIDKSKEKISKMRNDMQKWSQEDTELLSKDTIKEKYFKLLNESNASVANINKEIESLQNEISKMEESNKRLNASKKSLITSIVVNANVENDKPIASGELSAVLKKLNDFTLEKNGFLSNAGEEFLSKLNADSSLIKMIKKELSIDQELEANWKLQRSKLLKKISALENQFNEMSLNNRNLKTKLMVQPYKNNGDSLAATNSNNSAEKNRSSGSIQLPLSNNMSRTGSIDLISNNNKSINNGNADSAPPLRLHNPVSYSPSNEPIQPSSSLLSQLTQDTDNRSMLSNHISSNNESKQQPSSYSHALPTTATANATATATATNGHSRSNLWTTAQFAQPSHQQVSTELDQAFEYDNANHLISGLQNMIYDETDYPDNISNYSKGFTTDELDNYWTKQQPQVRSTNESLFSTTGTPMSSYKANPVISPYSSSHLRQTSNATNTNPMHPQSLLAATLNDPSLQSFVRSGSFYSAPQPANSLENNINGNETENISPRISSDFNLLVPNLSPRLSNDVPIVPGNNTTLTPLHSNILTMNHQPTADNSTRRSFHASSPPFNSIWNSNTNQLSPPLEEQYHLDVPVGPKVPAKEPNPKPSHKRNQSNSSISSAWSKFKHKSASSPANADTDIQDSSTPSTSPSGRRMSKLLSKSGMNNLFNPHSHDS